MYAKLAKNNAKKSIKDYLIYFLTITICVSLFYAITSLSSSDYELITEESYNFKNLKLILQYSTYIITGILVLLVSYVNKYMIRRRQREFATYILLGAEQTSVAFMFFVETLLIGIAAILTGIFVGTLFSQVITAIVLISAKQEILFSLRLYKDTVFITFIFFISMFCVIGLYNLIILSKIKLIDMLNAHKQVEFQFKRNGKVYSIIFIVSVILYSVCGYCTVKLMNAEMDYSIKSFIYIGISLGAFILGTYALFYSISYIMVHIKNKRIDFKYEGTNLFLIGSIVSKIKTAPILMSTISMTFLGSMISFIITLVMAQWAMGYLDMRVPYDIDIRNGYSNRLLSEANIDMNDIPNLDYEEIVKYLNDKGQSVEGYVEVEKYIARFDHSDEIIPVIKLSDFNELRELLGCEQIELKDSEFAIQGHIVSTDETLNEYMSKNSNLSIEGEVFSLSKNPIYRESIGEGFYGSSDVIIILPDKASENLTVTGINFVANIMNEMSYEEANYFEYDYVKQWFKNNNSEFIEKFTKEYDVTNSMIQTRIKSLETNDILNVTLAMRILGIYLGVVLLMISLTILSLSQLADSIEHKDRFDILRKLGIESERINSIILKQISIYFVIPISIALIGVSIFVYNFYLFYKDVITAYVGDITFVLSILFGVILMITVYICYFVGTYYSFKRNVNS